jgi:hypothetical protein
VVWGWFEVGVEVGVGVVWLLVCLLGCFKLLLLYWVPTWPHLSLKKFFVVRMLLAVSSKHIILQGLAIIWLV